LLAIGLLTSRPVLLADEPFDGLDLRQTREVAAALRSFARDGRTLVLSIHQISDAAKGLRSIRVFSGGTIRGEGTLGELMRSHHSVRANDRRSRGGVPCAHLDLAVHQGVARADGIARVVGDAAGDRPLVGMSFISAVTAYGELSGVNGTAAGVGEAFSPLVGIWGRRSARASWPRRSCCRSSASDSCPATGRAAR
jgi:energy-coupling factor transporter ATP-binding protein EcfA2